MRYLIFFLSLFAASAFALDVVVDGETIGQTDKLVIDGSKVVIDTTGRTPEPDPEPEPTPEPEPAPVVTCDQPDVTCNQWRWPNGESRRPFSIPQGTTVAYSFITTENQELRGSISFEARYDTMPNTDIWFSRSPGGEPLDQFGCEVMGRSFMYSLDWAQFETSRACTLELNTGYYFNIRHSSDETKQSYGYRWRTHYDGG